MEADPVLKKKAAVRHAEARRTSTCQFADRVAAASVAHYKLHVTTGCDDEVPNNPTCLATVVAFDSNDNTLTVLAMGVGTKFLPDSLLYNKNDTDTMNYGERVRDCHAEVLARRAFRRYLTNAMLHWPNSSSSSSSILQQEQETGKFQLKPETTLHCYCSSTPCGNSSLKKFGTMQKEKFRDDLSEWPLESHQPVPGHSIPLGQFALLIKKDRSVTATTTHASLRIVPKWRRQLPKKQQQWPVNCQTDWCPAGTTTVWSGRGSLHTCSDKLLRWNCLGWQGSLLSSLLMLSSSSSSSSSDKNLYKQDYLHVQSMTVGRKFSRMTACRAVCCRAVAKNTCTTNANSVFRVHHPAVMGTAVYMDATAVIDMSEAKEEGQDVRFHSSLSYASWVEYDASTTDHVTVECIDASTGLLAADGTRAHVSTAALVESFIELSSAAATNNLEVERTPTTLRELRRLKQSVSPEYEATKTLLLTKHPVLRDWRRREEETLLQILDSEASDDVVADPRTRIEA